MKQNHEYNEKNSTLNKAERKHIWEQFEIVELNLKQVFPLKSVVQNPMILTKGDANNFAEKVALAQRRLTNTGIFLEEVSNFVDSKLL